MTFWDNPACIAAGNCTVAVVADCIRKVCKLPER